MLHFPCEGVCFFLICTRQEYCLRLSPWEFEVGVIVVTGAEFLFGSPPALCESLSKDSNISWGDSLVSIGYLSIRNNLFHSCSISFDTLYLQLFLYFYHFQHSRFNGMNSSWKERGKSIFCMSSHKSRQFFSVSILREESSLECRHSRGMKRATRISCLELIWLQSIRWKHRQRVIRKLNEQSQQW